MADIDDIWDDDEDRQTVLQHGPLHGILADALAQANDPTKLLTPEQRARDIAASLFDGTILTERRLATVIAAAIREASDAAVADERKRCAQVADDAYNRYQASILAAPNANIPALAVKFSQGGQRAAADIADGIRALSTETPHD